MNQIMLYHENGSGTTVVSNLFIDRYMKDANDAQLKVYFYLLRCISNGTSFCISDIADQFNHTEKDVLRSLKYWERAGLISLDSEDGNHISGVHLLPIPEEALVPMALAPIIPMVPEQATLKIMPEAEEAPAIPKKPRYTAALLKEFAQEEEYGDMVCMVETYLNITVSPDDLKSLLYIHKELNFSCDMIDELLQYCVSKNQKKFSAIEKIATGWYELGISTPKQVKRELNQYDKRIYSIMHALGKNSNSPTAKEIEYMNKWMCTFGFSMEVILKGCERTVLATDSHRFEYADGIFANWKSLNIKTLDDITDAENAFRAKRSATTLKKASSENRFTKIAKNNYDFAALEKEILSN